jgi:multidrug resistance efflux pump
MALVTWDCYVTTPWTRDGKVRVQVSSVVPQVSGQIIELRVGDNQYVHKGDVLYVIDPFDFEVALHGDKARNCA